VAQGVPLKRRESRAWEPLGLELGKQHTGGARPWNGPTLSSQRQLPPSPAFAQLLQTVGSKGCGPCPADRLCL
jgi:hypothetical protein